MKASSRKTGIGSKGLGNRLGWSFRWISNVRIRFLSSNGPKNPSLLFPTKKKVFFTRTKKQE